MVMGNRNGFQTAAMMPHNMTMTVTGAGMLWVGWFGFNAGSAFAADTLAIQAFANAFIAGAAAHQDHRPVAPRAEGGAVHGAADLLLGLIAAVDIAEDETGRHALAPGALRAGAHDADPLPSQLEPREQRARPGRCAGNAGRECGPGLPARIGCTCIKDSFAGHAGWDREPCTRDAYGGNAGAA